MEPVSQSVSQLVGCLVGWLVGRQLLTEFVRNFTANTEDRDSTLYHTTGSHNPEHGSINTQFRHNLRFRTCQLFKWSRVNNTSSQTLSNTRAKKRR
jgi:hypothetical protein